MCASSAPWRKIELQFRGGLTAQENPTLFTEEAEAKAEATRRLAAKKAIESAIWAVGRTGVAAVQLVDGEGKVVFKQQI